MPCPTFSSTSCQVQETTTKNLINDYGFLTCTAVRRRIHSRLHHDICQGLSSGDLSAMRVLHSVGRLPGNVGPATIAMPSQTGTPLLEQGGNKGDVKTIDIAHRGQNSETLR